MGSQGMAIQLPAPLPVCGAPRGAQARPGAWRELCRAGSGEGCPGPHQGRFPWVCARHAGFRASSSTSPAPDTLGEVHTRPPASQCPPHGHGASAHGNHSSQEASRPQTRSRHPAPAQGLPGPVVPASGTHARPTSFHVLRPVAAATRGRVGRGVVVAAGARVHVVLHRAGFVPLAPGGGGAGEGSGGRLPRRRQLPARGGASFRPGRGTAVSAAPGSQGGQPGSTRDQLAPPGPVGLRSRGAGALARTRWRRCWGASVARPCRPGSGRRPGAPAAPPERSWGLSR